MVNNNYNNNHNVSKPESTGGNQAAATHQLTEKIAILQEKGHIQKVEIDRQKLIINEDLRIAYKNLSRKLAYDYSWEKSSKNTFKTAKKVNEWLEIVGLKGFGNTPTYQLSGGMQQRVALARCLINDPDLILMDEPLGALDALTREKMQSLVLKIWKETGKTIILITHSVEEALLLGERLYVMAPRPGRIHKEYNLPFAEMGLKEDLREIKKNKEFSSKREEILSMIWNMEEEIMGKEN